MSEVSPESKTFQPQKTQDGSDMVSIIAIVAVAIVCLACVAACTLMGYAFFSNPPW